MVGDIENTSFLENVRIHPGSLVFVADEGGSSNRPYPADWAAVRWHAIRILNGCYWSCKEMIANGHYVQDGRAIIVPTTGFVREQHSDG